MRILTDYRQISIAILLLIPIALTIWNIVTAILFLTKKEEKSYCKYIELAAILVGAFYLYMFLNTAELHGIRFVGWNTQLINSERHSIIDPNSVVTVLTLALVSFGGYLMVRFIPVGKQSPIVSIVGIAAVYLGIAVSALWCIQTNSKDLFSNLDLFLILFPANCIIILLKTIYIFVYQKNALIQSRKVSIKYKRMAALLNKATNLPWIALLFTIPLLGIVVAVLFLFGQEPASFIKAWTETADWTLSQKIPPQNIYQDQHYLCTVAAGGHRKIVKPLRTGMRHGHRVVVNRQLCIANAFEQVLEEKVPMLHKVIRSIYDSTGYPIAKHIHSPYVADGIFILMKPLEWMFLFVLYIIDVNPENRIAVQYPHAVLPNEDKGI